MNPKKVHCNLLLHLYVIGRSFFYAANWRECVWEDSRGSDHGGNCQQSHKDDRDCDNIQLEFYLMA